jgi:hypothetical protein
MRALNLGKAWRPSLQCVVRSITRGFRHRVSLRSKISHVQAPVVDLLLIGRTASPHTASAARAADRWPPRVSLNPLSHALAPELGRPSSDPAEPLPDLARFFFFQKTVLKIYLNLLDYKICRIFSECPNLVIQIFM